MRNRVDDDLNEFVRESEKASIRSALNDAEDWLYNDGSEAQKSEYKRKLEELKSLSAPVITRFQEFNNRANAVQALKTTIQNYQVWAGNTKDDKYSHIDANERKQVSDEAGKVDAWL